MRKIGAYLMAAVMAVPAFAQPVCAATCGGGEAVRVSCCCAPKDVPADGIPSLTAPSCCPSDTVRADLRDLEGAVSAGTGAHAAGAVQPFAAALTVAAAGPAPVVPAALPADARGAPATGPPIFISVSSLRL